MKTLGSDTKDIIGKEIPQAAWQAEEQCVQNMAGKQWYQPLSAGRGGVLRQPR